MKLCVLSLCVVVLLGLCESKTEIRGVTDEEPIIKEEGDSLVLECVTNEDEAIEWQFGGVDIDLKNKKYEVESDNITDEHGNIEHEITLTVNDLDPLHDAGTYECHIDGDVFDESPDVVVKVVRSAKLKITQAEGKKILHEDEHEDFTLECVGEPGSNPTWYRNDEELDHEADKDVTINTAKTDKATTSLLTVDNATEHDAGTYQCRDENHYQSDSKVVKIHIGDDHDADNDHDDDDDEAEDDAREHKCNDDDDDDDDDDDNGQANTTASGVMLACALVLAAAGRQL